MQATSLGLSRGTPDCLEALSTDENARGVEVERELWDAGIDGGEVNGGER